MKVTITLTNHELAGFMMIIGNCKNVVLSADGNELTFIYYEAMTDLFERLSGKIGYMKNKIKMTLNGIEIVALYNIIDKLYNSMGPYEQALVTRISDDIAMQIEKRKSLYIGNISFMMDRKKEIELLK